MLFTFTLILAAALSRLIPHPANVAPITALALFGGVYLDKKHTFIVPLAALFLSDYVIGFYSGIAWVYGSFLAIGFIGLWLRKHPGVLTTVGASLAGSVLFFLVTNCGWWLGADSLYPHTFAGLMQGYAAGIPFFRNTLLGDLGYVGAMFGVYELGRRLIPALKVQPELAS